MSTGKILMTGFLWLILVLVTGCTSSEVIFETGEQAETAETKETFQTDGMTGEAEVQTIAEKSEDLIYVYVCGQVSVPGVYPIVDGSRVFQAVDMAGGILPEGDLTRINLAAPLEDGQKVYIPSEDEMDMCLETGQGPEEAGTLAEDDANPKVNINKASKEVLMTLPGIGEAKADAILAYRQSEGPFEDVEALMQVPGIKEGVFTKIKDRISID